MSRKISDFFKLKPLKLNKAQAKSNAEVKNEAEENFEINFNKIQGSMSKVCDGKATFSSKIKQNSLKIIKIEPECGTGIYQENNLQNTNPANKEELIDKLPESIKSEPEKGFLINLPASLKLRFKSKSQKSLQCEICGLSFKRLALHMKRKHSFGRTGKYECDYDGKIFKNRMNFKAHMESHRPKIKCKICGLEMKVLSMKDHLKVVHSNERKHKCKICSKSFKLGNVLKNHLGSHDKKFECKICTKKFRNAPDLKNHTKEFHENPRSFKCEICEKGFYDKGNFKKHEKTHDKNREKAYKCDRCSFSTDNKAHYKLHENYHERWDAKIAKAKNPVKCTKCSIMLKDKHILGNHMKTVHPVHLFQCDLCAMFSKTKPNLEKHMNVVHLKNSKA